MSEAPKIEAATEPESACASNVTELFPSTPRTRRVPPMTDAEILEMRQMLVEFRKIKQNCPLAQRALSE